MTPLNSRDLRDAFGSFMSGVTVVTARLDDGTPVGFTANSFSSVSLDPPLLLVCPGKFLSSYKTFAQCDYFAVNILSEGQEDVSNRFASFKGDRFAQTPYRDDLNGVPLIDQTTAWFSCKTHQKVEAGDHCVLIGRVVAFEQTSRPGLGYVGGQYFNLSTERAALELTKGMAVCGAIVEQEGKVLLEKTPDGFRPPQCIHADRKALLDHLRDSLTDLGIKACFGPAYSVFEDTKDGTHHSYFLAETQGFRPMPNIAAVPFGELSTLSYTSPAIAAMMNRFALEARSQSFSFYLGDTEHGAVHDPNESI